MMERKFFAPQNCCLQIIDVQESLMAKIEGAEQVAATVGFMIECARILEIPVFGNTQYKKGLGSYVASVEPLTEDLPIFDKVEFNGLQNKETASFIEGLPAVVDTMILVGVETHICIYQTAKGLLDRGFSVWVVSDGVSSRSGSMHQEGLACIKSMGGIVGPAEMLVYELLGRAGTPKFKEVLPHIINRG
jgi:nicotinamidase-related amidase